MTPRQVSWTRHEAAEQAVVHSLTRRTPQGGRVADSIVREEQLLEELLARMQGMDPASDAFRRALGQLRAAVEDHATREEETGFATPCAACCPEGNQRPEVPRAPGDRAQVPRR